MPSFDPDEPDDAAQRTEGTVDLRADELDAAAAPALALLDEVTRDLPGGGESRAGQRQMVALIAGAAALRRSVVIEAGTGVGKSLGYLVPLARSRQKVVVATATKNLQDQLATKDAPLVARHVPGWRVAVLKGRQNYLCRLRLADAGGEGQLALEVEEVPATVSRQLRRVLEWSRTTTVGERDELPFEVDARVWRTVSVTPHECLGRTKCPHGDRCFAELAKDRAAEADVVVVNTHLYGAHLAAGSTILPDHDVVVFDEAHQAVDIFSQMLGTSVGAGAIRAAAGGARGPLGKEAASDVDALIGAAERLADALRRQLDAGETSGVSEDVATSLEESIRLANALVERCRAARVEGAETQRLAQAQGPLVHLANDLARVRAPAPGELVWLSGQERQVEIELSIVDPGARLAAELWPTAYGVLTSATIPDTLPGSLGLARETPIERVPSPFNYREHALLYVPRDVPTRTDDGAEAAIIEELTTLITAAGGRTLALFTNRAVMRRVAEAVAARVATPVMVQDTLSRTRLLERFKKEPATSLFAVASYWQGVDVPGDALRLVAIDRLPFARPDDPLSCARRDLAGDRAFTQIDLPRAAVLLAQGVGRLIRTTEDRGVVAVLDSRLATASYRGRLLDRLPPMRRTRERAEVVEFLRALGDG